MSHRRLSLPHAFQVPASFLLSGEYFVTEPDGLGLAAAVSPAARVTVSPAAAPSIRVIAAGSDQVFPVGTTENKLIHAICQTWNEDFGGLPTDDYPAQITIDTSVFFHADGRKRGFGSSAAACVGLCSALARLTAVGTQPGRNALAQLAIRAHRRFQGGRGSGYDIMTAAMGGVGIFRGGRCPEWTPLPWLIPALQPLWVINAPTPVSTPKSIPAFIDFCRQSPDHCERLRHRSRELHERLPEPADEPRTHLLGHLEAARLLGRELGDAIGITAEPDAATAAELEPAIPGVRCIKAVGAGAETLLALGGASRPHPQAVPLKPITEGVPGGSA